METYKSILAYDGTMFHGFQRQADGVRTVQGCVEEALRTLGWREESILAAGRTDAGVHARGQVISFRLAWKHSREALLAAVNAALPQDAALRSCDIAPADFHPRYDARSRMYRYTLVVDAIRSPLDEVYAWRRRRMPDMDLMQHVAAAMQGVHDFGAFGRPPRAGGSTCRNVVQAAWSRQGTRITFMVEANAFLYHMVRRMVAAMVACGEARETVQGVLEHLQQPRNVWDGGLAPAHGLCLEAVRYTDEYAASRHKDDDEFEGTSLPDFGGQE